MYFNKFMTLLKPNFTTFHCGEDDFLTHLFENLHHSYKFRCVIWKACILGYKLFHNERERRTACCLVTVNLHAPQCSRWKQLCSPPQILPKMCGRLPLDISVAPPSHSVTGFLLRWLPLALFWEQEDWHVIRGGFTNKSSLKSRRQALIN